MKPKNDKAKEYIRAFYRGNRLNWAVYLACTVLLSPATVFMSWVLGAIIDAAGTGDGARLVELAKLTTLFAAAVVAVSLLRSRSGVRATCRSLAQYKALAFKRLTGKSISAFSRENTSRYISTLTNDVTVIETKYLDGIPALINYILSGAGALLMMLYSSPLLTLATVVLAIPAILVSALMGGELAKRTQTVSDRSEGFVAQVKDLLAGFPVIKSFKAEKEAGRQFGATDAALEEAKVRRDWWQGMMLAAGETAGVWLMQFGIFFLGAYMAVRGRITAGDVLIFVNLCNPLMNGIGGVPQLWAEFKAARGLIEKLADAVEENAGRTGEAVEPVLNDAIELKEVSFGYEEGKPVLEGVDMRLEAGKKYALVGGSGSGKSTLLNLLMGAYDGYSGSITVDGKELKEIDADSLYDLESLIGQSVFLFDDTIRRNITMFRDFPDEAVTSAAQRSGLAALMEEKGEDYRCGENGGNLSGGERQRVSIARCLLRNTPVLLLDEATAALDNRTAFRVVDDLLKLDGVTRLVVTHRLEKELLEQYDGIFVLKNGKICEKGSFEGLMEEKGTFYSLYTLSA